MKKVYLDYAAAAPVKLSVAEMLSTENILNQVGNPSSTHSCGLTLRGKIDQARQIVGEILQAKTSEVIFTSGATESLWLSIVGSFSQENKGQILLVSPLVHQSVKSAARWVVKNFSVEIIWLEIDKQGFCQLPKFSQEKLEKIGAIVLETANSETGLIQEWEKFTKFKIEKDLNFNLILDGAGSLASIPFDFKKSGSDLASFSWEKIGGLAGSGVLLKKNGINWQSPFAGHQENEMRGGTENLWGIVAGAKALEIQTENYGKIHQKSAEFQQFLREKFSTSFPHCKISTQTERCLPHIFHFTIEEKMANLIVQKMDLAGFCISAGSACSSGNTEASKILQALNFSRENSIDKNLQGIRISWGLETTFSEIKECWEELKIIL
jgi:cysteine desulfurase